jgi:phosphocarrier protein
VIVSNRQGLHLRPAAKIAQAAARFKATVELVRGAERVNGKSVMDIAVFAAEKGTTLVIEASGPDAEQAIEAIAELFANNFEEDDEEEEKPAS